MCWLSGCATCIIQIKGTARWLAKKLTFYHPDEPCTIVMPRIMGGPQRQGASFQGQGAGLCHEQCRVLLWLCDT